MKQADLAVLMAAIGPVLRDFVDKAVAPLEEQLAELREGAAKEPPTAEDIEELVTGAIERGVAELPKPPTAEEVAALIPVPQDGKSVTLDDVRPLVEQAVAALPRPKDGEDGQDGKSITLDDVRPLIETAIAALPRAKDGTDGVGLAGALIDRDGELVVTLTDGTTKNLGPIIGKDGEPGKDGLGFDELAVTHDGERGFKFVLARGDQVKEFAFTLPVVLDRGVFKEGTTYCPGDGVTFGGSFWICRAETTDKPGTSDNFRLAVKKGRDGKDGVLKAPTDPAPVKLA